MKMVGVILHTCLTPSCSKGERFRLTTNDGCGHIVTEKFIEVLSDLEFVRLLVVGLGLRGTFSNYMLLQMM